MWSSPCSPQMSSSRSSPWRSSSPSVPLSSSAAVTERSSRSPAVVEPDVVLVVQATSSSSPDSSCATTVVAPRASAPTAASDTSRKVSFLMAVKLLRNPEGWSWRDLGAVVQVDHAAGEAMLVEQLEVEAQIGGQRGLAGADGDGVEVEVDLVDETVAQRLRGELRAADAEVGRRSGLELPDAVGFELALEPRARGGHALQRPRVDDLLGRPPDLCVLLRDGVRVALGRRGLPVGHRLVHPAAVEVGADRPLLGVDERMDLLVGRGPVEPAARI